MTKEEVLKLCWFYDGSEDCPYEPATNEAEIWGAERFCCDYPDIISSYERMKVYIHDFITKWDPYDGERVYSYYLDYVKNRLKGDNGQSEQIFVGNRDKEIADIKEMGLDVMAVERMKYMISHVTMPEIAEKGCELYFFQRTEPDEEFEYGQIRFVYNDPNDNTCVFVSFAMDVYYEHLLACELDPRMRAEENECIDQAWMDRKLKEE